MKHPNFDLMHNISFFSRFVFDEFIAKGGEYVHKVGRTPTNRVVERRNIVKSILGRELALRVLGRVCIKGSFDFELFFAFLWFAAFHAICWLCSFSF
jgi:hypothetical protein